MEAHRRHAQRPQALAAREPRLRLNATTFNPRRRCEGPLDGATPSAVTRFRGSVIRSHRAGNIARSPQHAVDDTFAHPELLGSSSLRPTSFVAADHLGFLLRT